MAMVQAINPKPYLASLIDKRVRVRLKWNDTEYHGRLVSVDSYMNLQLAGTEEYQAGVNKGVLGAVMIRCNNVLWIGDCEGQDENMTQYIPKPPVLKYVPHGPDPRPEGWKTPEPEGQDQEMEEGEVVVKEEGAGEKMVEEQEGTKEEPAKEKTGVVPASRKRVRPVDEAGAGEGASSASPRKKARTAEQEGAGPVVEKKKEQESSKAAEDRRRMPPPGFGRRPEASKGKGKKGAAHHK